jgi:hypothetical protein
LLFKDVKKNLFPMNFAVPETAETSPLVVYCFKSNCSVQDRHRELKLVSLKFVYHVCERDGTPKCPVTSFSAWGQGCGTHVPT